MSNNLPNVLLVSVDSLRLDYCSFLSGEVPPTPFLEVLGMEPPETKSVDLTRDRREAAYVYYRCSDTLFESAAEECDGSADDLPPARQYAIWRSPDRKTVWYPDEGEFDGPAADDDELRSQLVSHYESLEDGSIGGTETIGEETEENLRQMGYL